MSASGKRAHQGRGRMLADPSYGSSGNSRNRFTGEAA